MRMRSSHSLFEWLLEQFCSLAVAVNRSSHLLDVLLTDGVGNTKRLHIFFNKP